MVWHRRQACHHPCIEGPAPPHSDSRRQVHAARSTTSAARSPAPLPGPPDRRATLGRLRSKPRHLAPYLRRCGRVHGGSRFTALSPSSRSRRHAAPSTAHSLGAPFEVALGDRATKCRKPDHRGRARGRCRSAGAPRTRTPTNSDPARSRASRSPRRRLAAPRSDRRNTNGGARREPQRRSCGIACSLPPRRIVVTMDRLLWLHPTGTAHGPAAGGAVRVDARLCRRDIHDGIVGECARRGHRRNFEQTGEEHSRDLHRPADDASDLGPHRRVVAVDDHLSRLNQGPKHQMEDPAREVPAQAIATDSSARRRRRGAASTRRLRNDA